MSHLRGWSIAFATCVTCAALLLFAAQSVTRAQPKHIAAEAIWCDWTSVDTDGDGYEDTTMCLCGGKPATVLCCDQPSLCEMEDKGN
jgi:hypothetical protein